MLVLLEGKTSYVMTSPLSVNLLNGSSEQDGLLKQMQTIKEARYPSSWRISEGPVILRI